MAAHDTKRRARLEGFPWRAYDSLVAARVPRGVQVKVGIIDWPGGMPGDRGCYRTWEHPEGD